VVGAFWLAWTAEAQLNPDRWRWSNPLPHGNNVLDMFVAGDLAVQVGDAGTVHVQRSTTRWAPAITGVTNYLRGTTLLGERILVTGENGCILWSDDGKVFQPASLSPPTLDWFEGVAANTVRAVAVGDYGSIYTSTNGVNWTPSASGTAEWLRGVAVTANTYVAVGENGKVVRSSNGTSWSPVTPFTGGHLNRVRFLGLGPNARFVTVGNGGAAFSSSTGASGTWTSLNAGTTNDLLDVVENDLGLLLVGDGELRLLPAGTTTWTNFVGSASTNAPPDWIYLSTSAPATNRFWVAGRTGLLYEGLSTNGVPELTWSPLPDSSHAWLWDLLVVNGSYVAVGDLATILTSLDGIVWAREVAPPSATNSVLLGVGGDTNRLFTVGNTGTLLVSHAGWTNITVTNLVGTNWVVTNTTLNTLGLFWNHLPAFTTQNLQGVAFDAGRYVVCGGQGNLFTCADGTNWLQRSTPTTSFLSSVAPYPGGWVASGANGTLLRAEADAASWTAIPTGTTNWLYRVRHVGGQLVAVGQNGTLFTSTNGLQWTVRTTGTSKWLNDVAYVDGTWFVTGTQGAFLSSTNLTQWTPQRIPTIKSLFAAGAYNGQLLLAGVEGVVLRNLVRPPTSPVNVLDYSRTVASITFGTGTNAIMELNAYELFLFGGQPDQQFQVQTLTNLADGSWTNLVSLELYDPSGTLYLVRTRDATNVPPDQFYRTRLLP
jgi:hypothetical protein